MKKYCKSFEKRKLRPWSEFPPRQLTQTMVRVNCQDGDGGGSWVGGIYAFGKCLKFCPSFQETPDPPGTEILCFALTAVVVL